MVESAYRLIALAGNQDALKLAIIGGAFCEDDRVPNFAQQNWSSSAAAGNDGKLAAAGKGD